MTMTTAQALSEEAKSFNYMAWLQAMGESVPWQLVFRMGRQLRIRATGFLQWNRWKHISDSYDYDYDITYIYIYIHTLRFPIHGGTQKKSST